MKKAYCILLLLLVMIIPVNAGAEDIYLHEESHWLVAQTEDTLIVLADEYVLDFHYDGQDDRVYYTALDNGKAVLRCLSLEERTRSTLPLIREEELTLLSEPSKSIEAMVDAAMTLIYRNEGNYGSVNKADGQALSIGKVQWHGNRALDLLKIIVNADEQQAREILGDSLCNEIIISDSWNSRTVNDEEKDRISKLLTTDAGKAAQDAQAATDITSYVEHAIGLGLRSSTAIVYYADVENQWGYGDAADQAKDAMKMAGSYEAVTLDILHQACLNYTSKEYIHKRREAAYRDCLKLGWDEFALDTPNQLMAQTTGNTVRLSWDSVEHAKGYICYIIDTKSGFAPVLQLKTEQSECTITLEPNVYYAAYVVATGDNSTSQSSLWVSFATLMPKVSMQVNVVEGQQTPVYEVSWMVFNGKSNYQVIAAGYREGKMVIVEMMGVSGDDNRMTITDDVDEIRLMLVDGALSWAPMCQAESFLLQQEP